MSTRSGFVRSAAAAAVALGVAAVCLPSERAEGAEGEPCDAYDVQYTLAARLRLDDTPMGEGNGVYDIGPGETVLRFEQGKPGAGASQPVQMRSYRMREKFTISTRTLFWKTTVVDDSNTSVGADRCGVVARGKLEGRALHWTTPLSGYRTDGTLTCTGSMCGRFGAPPPGSMALHIGPHGVPFETFQFSPDLTTFTMASTQVSKTDMPKQTAFLALSGREVRRTCVRSEPCK